MDDGAPPSPLVILNPAPLWDEIDRHEPGTPCRAALEALCDQVAAEGGERTAADPSGAWVLLGLPVSGGPAASGRPGCVVVGAPAAAPVDPIPLAARTGLAESRVVALLEAIQGEAGEHLRAGVGHIRSLVSDACDRMALAAQLERPPAPAPAAATAWAGAPPDPSAHLDLQARVRAHNQELTQERLRLQEVLQAMAEPMVITDRDGRVTLANGPAAQILGAAAGALPGQEAAELFVGGGGLGPTLARLRADAGDRVTLTTQVARDERDVELRVSAVADEGGETLGFVIALRDVTALRELERLRDEFISNVSHEVRTPLATLRGVALTLLEDEEMDAEDRQDFLRIVDREAQRLAVLTEDMLAMSRLEASRSRPRVVPIDLRRHVTELEREFGPLCADSGVRLSVSRGARPAVVDAEPGLLGQVGKNLVGNALKFTPRGGHIQLSVTVRGAQTVLRVRDSGLGIPAADQAHVFDRFYRSSHAARTVRASGLGLALVKRIADAHGWTVGLTSREGEGTDVWVEMPLGSDEEPAA